jgi:hypothetical protein
MTTELDGWVVRRLLADLPLNGEISHLSGVMRQIADHLAGIPLQGRQPAWNAMLAVAPDRDEIIKAVVAADPMGPPPEATSTDNDVPIPIPEWVTPPDGAAFDGLAGQIVKLFEPHTEADPIGLLVQLLIGYGNALGRGVHVRADGHDHYANEFAVLVGE